MDIAKFTTSGKNQENLNSFRHLLSSIPGIKVYRFGSGVTQDTKPTTYSDIDLLVTVLDESKLESTKHHCIALFQKSFGPNSNILNFDRNNNEIYLVSPDGECALHFHIYSSKTHTIMTDRKHDLLINTCNTYEDNRVIEALQHLTIRTYRLMSKIESQRYQELVGVFSELRDTILIPLLGFRYMQTSISNPKFFKPENLPKEIADLYIKCYPNPTKNSCLEAIKSCFTIIKKIINEDDGLSHIGTMVDNLNNKIQGEGR